MYANRFVHFFLPYFPHSLSRDSHTINPQLCISSSAFCNSWQCFSLLDYNFVCRTIKALPFILPPLTILLSNIICIISLSFISLLHRLSLVSTLMSQPSTSGDPSQRRRIPPHPFPWMIPSGQPTRQLLLPAMAQ